MDKVVYVDVYDDPQTYSVTFRVKDAQGNPLPGVMCKLFESTTITPLTPMITSALSNDEGKATFYTILEGSYGYVVKFPVSGVEKVGSVIVDKAHAL